MKATEKLNILTHRSEDKVMQVGFVIDILCL